MKIIIETVTNGWITSQDDGENVSSIVGFTYEDEEYDKGVEVKKFASLLQYLNDTIGPTTSRYDKTRIFVKLDAGDKYEDSV